MSLRLKMEFFYAISQLLIVNLELELWDLADVQDAFLHQINKINKYQTPFNINLSSIINLFFFIWSDDESASRCTELDSCSPGKRKAQISINTCRRPRTGTCLRPETVLVRPSLGSFQLQDHYHLETEILRNQWLLQPQCWPSLTVHLWRVYLPWSTRSKTVAYHHGPAMARPRSCLGTQILWILDALR